MHLTLRTLALPPAPAALRLLLLLLPARDQAAEQSRWASAALHPQAGSAGARGTAMMSVRGLQ